MTYEYQSVDHDASISTERVSDSIVNVRILVGAVASVEITMWLEDFERMAREILGGK